MGHVAVPADEQMSAAETITHVSNSTLLPEYELRVVDPQGGALPPARAGRLLLRTPCLFKGYFRREDLNKDIFDEDGFFDTGDVGYVDDEGHLYVTGRLKDLIIVGGRNIYAHDVEAVAIQVPGVHPGRTVCFGVTLPSYGTEGVVLLVESDEPEEKWPEVVERVRAAVARQADVDLFDARVAPRKMLRKSTAGKLARLDNRAWYLEGRFGPLPRQLVRAGGG
jgi:fatty-acyl-CoA synthase